MMSLVIGDTRAGHSFTPVRVLSYLVLNVCFCSVLLVLTLLLLPFGLCCCCCCCCCCCGLDSFCDDWLRRLWTCEMRLNGLCWHKDLLLSTAHRKQKGKLSSVCYFVAWKFFSHLLCCIPLSCLGAAFSFLISTLPSDHSSPSFFGVTGAPAGTNGYIITRIILALFIVGLFVFIMGHIIVQFLIKFSMEYYAKIRKKDKKKTKQTTSLLLPMEEDAPPHYYYTSDMDMCGGEDKDDYVLTPTQKPAYYNPKVNASSNFQDISSAQESVSSFSSSSDSSSSSSESSSSSSSGRKISIRIGKKKRTCRKQHHDHDNYNHDRRVTLHHEEQDDSKTKKLKMLGQNIKDNVKKFKSHLQINLKEVQKSIQNLHQYQDGSDMNQEAVGPSAPPLNLEEGDRRSSIITSHPPPNVSVGNGQYPQGQSSVKEKHDQLEKGHIEQKRHYTEQKRQYAIQKKLYHQQRSQIKKQFAEDKKQYKAYVSHCKRNNQPIKLPFPSLNLPPHPEYPQHPSILHIPPIPPMPPVPPMPPMPPIPPPVDNSTINSDHLLFSQYPPSTTADKGSSPSSIPVPNKASQENTEKMQSTKGQSCDRSRAKKKKKSKSFKAKKQRMKESSEDELKSEMETDAMDYGPQPFRIKQHLLNVNASNPPARSRCSSISTQYYSAMENDYCDFNNQSSSKLQTLDADYDSGFSFNDDEEMNDERTANLNEMISDSQLGEYGSIVSSYSSPPVLRPSSSSPKYRNFVPSLSLSMDYDDQRYSALSPLGCEYLSSQGAQVDEGEEETLKEKYDDHTGYDVLSPRQMTIDYSEDRVTADINSNCSGGSIFSAEVPRVYRELNLSSRISSNFNETKKNEETMNMNIFAPSFISRGFEFDVSLWCFLVTQKEEMLERIAALHPSSRAMSQRKKMALTRGENVMVELELPPAESGIQFSKETNNIQDFLWKGEIEQVSFRLKTGACATCGQWPIKIKVVVGARVALLRAFLLVIKDKPGNETPVVKLESKLEVLDESHVKKIPYQSLKLDKMIGQGFFGDAHLATLDGQKVVVKTIRQFGLDSGDKKVVDEFRHEAATLALFGHHPNVVPFIGACWNDDLSEKYPLALVTEYSAQGSLQQCLRSENANADIETRVAMLKQASCGVLNMHQGSFVHRDIAARNCLVDEFHHVRLCDFGLSRSIDKRGVVYCPQGQGPLKYWPPESLQPPHSFSFASDAYMFGILIWETLTAKHPFADLKPIEAATRVLEGERLAIPLDIPLSLQELMTMCFQQNPEERPTLQYIYHTLQNYQ